MPAPSLTTADSGLGQDTVKTVFDRMAFFAFRANNIHRQVADVRWSENDPPMPGNPVTFTKMSALAPATSALGETTEPTPVGLGDSTKSITLAEYGNVVTSTEKVRVTSFYNLDMAVPREVAANMEESMDLIARAALIAATNVILGNVATQVGNLNLIAATNVMTPNTIRFGVQKLRKRNVPFPGGRNSYPVILHPDVAYDLMTGDTALTGWLAPHAYSDPSNIWNGEIGTFAGASIISNANANLRTDIGSGAGGAGTIDGYDTLFLGVQALGEAVGVPQGMRITGPFDNLRRFVNVGWYALEGFGIIREESIQRIVTASSIGTNT